MEGFTSTTIASALAVAASTFRQDDEDASLRELETGVAVPPSTLGTAIGHEIAANAVEFNAKVPTVSDPDPQLGSNPIQALNLAPKIADAMADRLESLTYAVDSAIQPMSAAGTALLVRKAADVQSAGPPTIDVLPSSHVFHVDKEQRPEQRLLACMSYPFLDRGSLLVDHRDAEIGYRNVPTELARAILTLGHTDVTNLGHRYRTIAYDTVRTGGKSQQQLSQDVHTKANQLTPWFTPEDWAPWADDVDAIDSDDARTVVAVVPRRYDKVQGDGINIRTEYADVENAHVLALFPLGTDWVEDHLKRGGLEYVDEQIRASDNEIAYTWESMALDFGIGDSVAKWEQLRDETFEPALEQ